MKNEYASWLWHRWMAIAGDSDDSRQVWTELIERWDEPARHYHGLSHLILMLQLLDGHAEPATEIAAWFHDAVYDAQAKDNEQRSADLATELLPAIGLGDMAPRVHELVLMTLDHQVPDGDDQATLLIDADLAILGQSPATYLRYVEGVRAEYAHVPDADFARGRSAILQGLLDREQIFGHQAFRYLEQSARTNVEAELKVYESRSVDA